MIGWSPFLGWSPSNCNLLYHTQIWLPKILTGQEFGFQNIVDEVIEEDELDKGNISAALGKAELSCATLRNKPTQKMSPPLYLHTAAEYVVLRNFFYGIPYVNNKHV